MLEKSIRFILLVLMTLIALGILAGMLAIMAMALVLTVVVILTAYALAPEPSKAFWSKLRGEFDGWISRLEALWGEIKGVVDHFVGAKGEAPQADAGQAQTAETSEAASEPTETAAIESVDEVDGAKNDEKLAKN